MEWVGVRSLIERCTENRDWVNICCSHKRGATSHRRVLFANVATLQWRMSMTIMCYLAPSPRTYSKKISMVLFFLCILRLNKFMMQNWKYPQTMMFLHKFSKVNILSWHAQRYASGLSQGFEICLSGVPASLQNLEENIEQKLNWVRDAVDITHYSAYRL